MNAMPRIIELNFWIRSVFLTLVLAAASTHIWAASNYCKKMDAEAGRSDESFRPPMEAKVVVARGIHLYSAPSTRCKVKNASIKSGTFLTVYKPYIGWLSVMYVATDGETLMGWVREREVELLKVYGTSAFGGLGRGA